MQKVVVLFANRFDRELILFVSELSLSWRPHSKKTFWWNVFNKKSLLYLHGPTKKTTNKSSSKAKKESLKTRFQIGDIFHGGYEQIFLGELGKIQNDKVDLGAYLY